MSTSKLVIGLTGGIGSGKSAAADFFERLDIDIIDADIAARKVIEPGEAGLDGLIAHFGTNILNSDKSLDRQKLRLIIFSDPNELEWLNSYMHPLIRDWMDKQTQQASSNYVIKVIPLLTESNIKQSVDRVLVIDVPTETQIKRVSKRDKSSAEEVRNILASQASREQRLSIADDVIVNDSSYADLELEVKKMHQKYLNLL